MKKKPLKKMTLRRETLYGLAPADLPQVKGGFTQHVSCEVACSAVCTATICSVCCP